MTDPMITEQMVTGLRRDLNSKTHLWKHMKAEWGDITAEALIPVMRGEWISGPKDAALNGLSTDSRNIAQGQLFLALKGERYDGHDFITQAVDQGAAGVVMAKGYHPEIPTGKRPVLMAVRQRRLHLFSYYCWAVGVLTIVLWTAYS